MFVICPSFKSIYGKFLLCAIITILLHAVVRVNCKKKRILKENRLRQSKVLFKIVAESRSFNEFLSRLPDIPFIQFYIKVLSEELQILIKKINIDLRQSSNIINEVINQLN